MMVQVGFWQLAFTKRAAIHHEQVPDIMRLLKLIQDRGLRVAAHARSAQFMDGPALSQDTAIHMHNVEARSLEHLLGSFLHVLSHAMFVVAKLVMKTQSRDAPLIFHNRIQIDVVFVTRQRLRRMRPC